MAEFLTTQGSSKYIEDIIRNAKNKLFLISPYLQLSQNFSERLKDADRRNVKITLVYGKDELKPEEKRGLQELSNLSLYFYENLHAKCFFNEECMVVTSMNMYEYSQQNNREMGILIRANDDDKAVFDEAVKEAQSIIRAAEKVKLGSSILDMVVKEAKSMLDSATKDDSRTPRRTKKDGFCIRCGTIIPYNLEHPYCLTCYKDWREGGGNPDYRERDGKCHACGKPAPAKMAKPLCDSCYNRSQR